MTAHRSTRSSISTRRAHGATVVRLRGEIDVNLRPQALDALSHVRAAGLPVVVDLSDVRLLGAPGLALLAQCRRVCARDGLPCEVRHVPDHVARLVATLGMEDLLGDGARDDHEVRAAS